MLRDAYDGKEEGRLLESDLLVRWLPGLAVPIYDWAGLLSRGTGRHVFSNIYSNMSVPEAHVLLKSVWRLWKGDILT
jgi:hypothetical protein